MSQHTEGQVAAVTGENLARDARNRALRTLWQGVGIDVVTAVLLAVVTAMESSDGWGTLEWSLLAYSVVKTAVQTVLAWLMRAKIDGSPVPTPLPPEATPNEDEYVPKHLAS